MKKILVTGGAGYIGSHASVELLAAEYEIVIIDNLSNSDKSSLDGIEKITGKKVEFTEVDICNKEELKKVFFKYGNFDLIMHFAAYKAVGESVKNPLKYYDNNLVSLINILWCMQEFGVKYLVQSSSASVYGDNKELPIKEDADIAKSESPYANTKKISEEIINDFVKSDQKINATLLRYFNPIGAHQSALIGEMPIGEPNNLVPYIMQTAIGKRNELKIFGSDYNTDDGYGVRDYIHVVDLAKAHVAAANRLLNQKNQENTEIFNLGAGRGYSVKEVIDTFESISGQKLNYKVVDRRAGDIAAIYADPGLANAKLGWKTSLSLKEALLSAWEWEQSRVE